MTALIVKFKAQKVGEGGGVSSRRRLRDEKMNAEQGDDEESKDKQRQEAS